jgi:hypothetical protein
MRCQILAIRVLPDARLQAKSVNLAPYLLDFWFCSLAFSCILHQKPTRYETL